MERTSRRVRTEGDGPRVSPALDDILPDDAEQATLVGRMWDADTGGPRVIAVRGRRAVDVTSAASTVSALLESDDPVALLNSASGGRSWELQELIDGDLLLAPLDLQVIKACGVTFAESMIERLIEERAGGDSARATELRETILGGLADAGGGGALAVRAGSPEAASVKQALVAQGLWSPYLEVGIGPDPEIFTKGPVLSAVGYAARVGIPRFSEWNNPEPELVLAVDSHGTARGASLGNDVNLRDVEGRSALLLGMAKDNNASTAVGPFLRLFDSTFTIDALRNEDIDLTVTGEDGYVLHGRNSLSQISRPFEALVSAAIGSHHQYPDGLFLFTGTLFAPTKDRDVVGQGFTHKLGDTVTIRSSHLGSLTNVVGRTEDLPPWTFGVGALLRYLGSLTD
jgi:fumarylacetoacetate (FAA) hydrolase family protein